MTQRTISYPDEQTAARQLLSEATTTLNSHKVNYLVVGGWSPYLFHSQKYGHPGTFDVDVLLDSRSLDDASFNSASNALLSNGYMRAPKNVFQAHRVLNVSGEDLVFHIDFLNEREPTNEIEIVTGQGRMKSVYTEIMKAVFKYADFRTHPAFPNVRFPSPETFIATKAVAASVKKRQRDAFDIFVTVQDMHGPTFTTRWANLCQHDGLFLDANNSLYEAVHEGNAIEKVMNVLTQMNEAGLATVPLPNESEVIAAFDFLLSPI